MEEEHIKGSPFPVTVIRQFGDSNITCNISGLKQPWGVAVSQRGELLVAENGSHCVSIFSPTGEKLGSFGSEGSGPGQFREPRGIAVDDDGNILVTDACHIQQFSPEYKFLESVGSSCGNNHLQFNHPVSVAISPVTKKIAVLEPSSHRIQILNPDLTFNNIIGTNGSAPVDIAFNSVGNIYVVDYFDHCIYILSPEGNVLKKFGYGYDDKSLEYPSGISIDSDDIVYVTDRGIHILVYSPEGKYLTSLGSDAAGVGQFERITMDKNGTIYVSDIQNNCIQIF